MIRLHQPAAESSRNAPSLMPARLLRRVLVGRGHSIGKRVLVIGSDGALAEWLFELGYEVASENDEPRQLSQFVAEPHDFNLASCGEQASPEGDELFHLVLIDGRDSHHDSLLELSRRRMTARLLAKLKPGGDLVVLRPSAKSAIHNAACWARHLACFPGRLETEELPRSWLERLAVWQRKNADVFRSSQRDLVVSFRIPQEPLSTLEWQQHAQRGLLTGSGSCCAAVEEFHSRLRAA